MRYTFNTLALLLLVSFNALAQISSQPPAQTIPAFQFFKLNNTSFTDKNLPQDKLIFIMFFDPDCDHCQHAIKAIGEQYEVFKKTNMFLISVADQTKIDHFITTFGGNLKGQKNVTILQDKLNQFIVKFNPLRYPSMFIYSPQKKLIDYEDNPESVFRLVNAINKNAK